MSANKENLKAVERRKSTMKGNKEETERNPLKTLSLYSNSDHCLAGPSSGSSRPLDTRYVTHRNHCEELDWGFMVFKDTPRKPDRTDNKDKYKVNEKTTESKRTKKYDRTEREPKVKKTEKEPSYRERDPEYFQSTYEKFESIREKKTADAIQFHPDQKTEKIEPNKENITYTIDLSKKEDKNDKEDIAKTENTGTNDENVHLAPVVSVVIKNTPLVVVNTPNVEIYPTRKIKRSLKRPLARLLATTSPVSAKSCQFTIYSSNDIKVPILSVGKCFDPLNKTYMMDNLKYLLQTEKKVLGEPRIRRASRSCVINWIINVNGSSGNPAVVQLASWYFDCYLSSAWVTVDRLQVIAAACFWIATKYHGRIVSGNRLVKYSGHAFIEQELVAAERNILRKLKFKALPVVPHDFVPYLAWCCDVTTSGVVEAAAVFLCQCGVMTDKTLSEEYPSVVAAAAVKNALILLKMDASMHKLIACPVFEAAMNKTVNLDTICAQLRDAVRVVASVGYEYKAPLFKFSGPPHYISNNIVRAVNHKDIVLMDIRERRIKKSI